MSDQTPVEPARALVEFTPVPRLKNRSDGWTPEIQRAFIEALADTGSVASACRMVGRSEGSACTGGRAPVDGRPPVTASVISAFSPFPAGPGKRLRR